MSSFEYPHMPFPAGQIRLLSVAHTESYNELHFSLAAFPFDPEDQPNPPALKPPPVNQSHTNLPPYGALSYTWGTSDPTPTVIVNKQPFTVTPSCYYALQQVTATALQNTSPGTNVTHYWIDSICINQSDLLEKAAQVTMMGAIYRRASRTFACVGGHADDSQLLMGVVQKLDFDGAGSGLLEFQGCVPWGPACDRALEGVLKDIDDDIESVLKRLVHSVRAFRKREYWNRLWVVQELRLSRATLLMCGGDAVQLLHIARLESHFLRYTTLWTDAIRKMPGEGGYNANKMQITVGGIRPTEMEEYVPSMAFWAAVQTSYAWKCADARDRVFGLLSIVEWPVGIEPLKPDYTISRMELARRCLPGIVAYLKEEGEDQSDPVDDWGVARIVGRMLELEREEEETLGEELRTLWAGFEQRLGGYSMLLW